VNATAPAQRALAVVVGVPLSSVMALDAARQAGFACLTVRLAGELALRRSALAQPRAPLKKKVSWIRLSPHPAAALAI
jgi:hypothetical protein